MNCKKILRSILPESAILRIAVEHIVRVRVAPLFPLPPSDRPVARAFILWVCRRGRQLFTLPNNAPRRPLLIERGRA